jgi:succinate dehydrogenase hydrophobic anchor subunit
VAKRLLSPPSSKPRKLTSTLSLAGYSALLVFVPIHFITHRLAPTDAASPIFAVGPSELDYEFVKTGLAQFPWRSWALYTGLVASVLLHAVEGMQVIMTTQLGAARVSSGKRRLVAGAVALPVLLGVWTLSREPLMALSSVVGRYSASFTSSWVYRI